MTGMLASVSSMEEARLLISQADILDLKEPKAGSLGALVIDDVAQIVKYVNKQCLVSATVGDLPMQPALVYTITQAVAETGVDFIKIGFLADGDAEPVLKKLALLIGQYRLITVLFADLKPDFGFIDSLYANGFCGVMLDTFDKSNGALTDIMPLPDIQRFVTQVKSKQLLCGLAGSLREVDIPVLCRLTPDYLGFRGALCDQGDRLARLNSEAVLRIKQAIVGAG